MQSSAKYSLVVGVIFLFFFSIPFSSGFSGSDFLTDYKSLIVGYISFFKHFGPTGRAVSSGSSGSGSELSPAPQPSPQHPCDAAGNCPIGYYCQNNNCYQYTCFDDTDCPPNLVCRNGACGLRPCTNDRDRDGICDDVDNCPDRYNFDQSDIDFDTVGDVCDNCPRRYNPDQIDSHRPPNGRGDACDPVTDTDGDHVRDEDDNCPTTYNPDQEDADQDDIGDACDPCPLIRGPCNQLCTITTDTCDPECPLYPNEPADSDGDGFAWAGCFREQTACNRMVQCCEEIAFTHCGDCDDVDDDVGRNSYPGADELCDDGADNNCDGDIDEGCGADDEGEDEDDSTYLLVRTRNPRSATAREAMLIENLDLAALKNQLITLQKELALTQATLKAILAYFYATDSASDTTQQLLYLQNELELLLAQGRSLIAKIDAEEPNEFILEDTQHHSTDIEQMNLALKDVLTRI